MPKVAIVSRKLKDFACVYKLQGIEADICIKVTNHCYETVGAGMKKKKNPSKLMNIPCHDCVTQSVPDCGKCRLIKKNDLVEALTSKARVYLDEDGRNNAGCPEKLSETDQYYLAANIHMGDTLEKAGANYKVSKATAHRVYARYKDGFGTPRRVVKRRSPRKSPNSQKAG